jgi:uncharacterized Zn finger protein
MDISTCEECSVTNKFRIIKEEIESANLSKKLPVSHCPNCGHSLEESNLPKCPQCKCILNKQTNSNFQKPNQNGQYSRDLNNQFDQFLPKFSLT